MTRPWEIERDRFGLMFSGPLEVGEEIEVVPAERAERAEAAARDFAKALASIVRICEGSWRHQQIGDMATRSLAAHPSYIEGTEA